MEKWPCVCVCVRFTDGSENVSKVQTVLEARCLMSSNIRLTVSHSHAGKKDGEQMAQWYVYWEALDNRKGDGCCWNVTIIDQKTPKKKKKKKDHRHQHPYLETRTHAQSFIHKHSSPPLQSLQRERNRINAQDKTVSQVLRVNFYMKKFTVNTSVREISFLGTAKAIRSTTTK